MWKIILISLLVLTSCKKKNINCTAQTYNAPGNIGFTGFNKNDLDILIISSYTANDSFTNLISTDTVISPHVAELSGNLFADSAMAPFANINTGADLEIFLPSVGRTFHVHAVYSSNTTVSWIGADGECGTVGAFVVGPTELIVDGNTIPDTSNVEYRYFFLHS